MSILGKLALQAVIGRAVRSTLLGRPRCHAHPARGRFGAADIDEILDTTWRFARAQPGRPDPEASRRIRATVRLASISLALFDALLLHDVEREYAIEIVADVAARLARWWGRIGRGILRVHPYWPDGWVERGPPPFAICPAAVATRPTGRGGFEVTECPVAELMRAHDAGDLCRAAWCDNAYAISEEAGVTLRKASTLAAGAPACHLWWQRE